MISDCLCFTTCHPYLLHVDKDQISLKSLIFDEIFTVTHRFTEDKARSLFFLLSLDLVAKNEQIIN